MRGECMQEKTRVRGEGRGESEDTELKEEWERGKRRVREMKGRKNEDGMEVKV